jgi:N6-adenosine-specific RNA methylase IME4
VNQYDVILADPPWHFENYSADEPGMMHDRARGPNRYYPTMTTADICALQVPAADNAVLFMWACWPLMPAALQVISAWGFEYKTLAWVWVKANRSGMGFFYGMGYYTRANSEPCLLATRGSLPKPVNRGIQALIYSPVREHSRKPDDQYRKIEALYPGRRYLELFARRKRTNWDAWGNEVACDVTLPAQLPLEGGK